MAYQRSGELYQYCYWCDRCYVIGFDRLLRLNPKIRKLSPNINLSTFLRNLLPRIVHNCFDATAFKCDRHSQAFLQRLFQRGKFLLLVTGNVRDIDSAGKIISRRPNYAKFWHL